MNGVLELQFGREGVRGKQGREEGKRREEGNAVEKGKEGAEGIEEGNDAQERKEREEKSTQKENGAPKNSGKQKKETVGIPRKKTEKSRRVEARENSDSEKPNDTEKRALYRNDETQKKAVHTKRPKGANVKEKKEFISRKTRIGVKKRPNIRYWL